MQRGEKNRIMLPKKADDSVKKFETPESKQFTDLWVPKPGKSKKNNSEKAVIAYRLNSTEIVPREPTVLAPNDRPSKNEDARDSREETPEERHSGRERLKRHRVEVAGRVWIPEMWGQEDLLKDWIDCTAFDSILANSTIVSARESLIEEGRRANSTRFRVQNSC